MTTPADDWYDRQTAWRAEVAALRAIVLGAGLTETLRWRQPCYTDGGRNILLVSSRKDYAIVSFFKGALLEDPGGRLIQPGQDRSVRYLRFADLDRIQANAGDLQALIARAVAIERAGGQVAPPPDEIDTIPELRERLEADAALRAAFEALTPGRRRGYNLYFAKSKGSSARAARVSRCTERILMGKGLLDCTCGLTRRPPGCDGSHRGA